MLKLKYFVNKLLVALLTIFLVLNFIYLALEFIPGLSGGEKIASGITPEALVNITDNQQNLPPAQKYFNFLSNTITLNFGESVLFRKSVSATIYQYLPVTIILALTSVIFQILLSVIIAWLSFRYAINRRILNSIMISFFSVPTFVTGLLLILFFSVIMGLLPVSAQYKDGAVSAQSLILPVIALTLSGTPVLFRYLIEELDNQAGKNYILFLNSLGLPEYKIFFFHLLPNSVNPLITVVGIELGILLGGTLVTEVLFGLPGFGRLTVNAILHRDFHLIVGCTFFSSLFIIGANFSADLIKYSINKKFNL